MNWQGTNQSRSWEGQSRFIGRISFCELSLLRCSGTGVELWMSSSVPKQVNSVQVLPCYLGKRYCERSVWWRTLEYLSKVLLLILVRMVCAPLLRVRSMTWMIFLRESLEAVCGRLELESTYLPSLPPYLLSLRAVLGREAFIENSNIIIPSKFYQPSQLKQIRWRNQDARQSLGVQLHYNSSLLLNMIKSTDKSKDLTKPLLQKPSLIRTISNLSDSSQESNKQIDMLRLVSKAERSRITKIKFNTYKLTHSKEDPLIRHSEMVSPKFLQDQLENDKYSTHAQHRDPQRIMAFPENESFLSNYEDSRIIGIVLFILFILLLAAEVVTTTYLVPQSSHGGSLILEETLLTVLASELAYYLLIRYLSNLGEKPLFNYKSASFSFKKLMQKTRYHSSQSEGQSPLLRCLFERPYVLLGVVAALVIVSQLVYSILAEQSMRLFDNSSPENYMISTIYWAYFGLPFLVSNFYLNRPVEDQNIKLRIFPYLVLAFMLQSVLESWLFFVLMLCRITYVYIQQKQEFEVFHVEQLIKAAFLAFSVIFFQVQFISDQRYDHEYGESFVSFYFRILWHTVLITISMLLARIIALTYIKQQLYRHFYTEMHINLAIITTAIALNLCELGFHPLHDGTLVFIFLNLIFLGLIAVIVYQQGREKMLVSLEYELPEEHN